MFLNKICFRENEHVILCLKNGELSIERFHWHEPVKFSNVCVIPLSYNFKMETHLLFSHDNMNLIIYNSSGSIISYKWKMIRAKNENISIYRPCAIEHKIVDEIITFGCLSLEQQKQVELKNNRKIQVQKRKAEILEIIANLKNEFCSIKEKNGQLPENFRLPNESFEIDKRITDDLEWRTQEKFKVIQTELQRKIDKMRSQAERMEHTYLDNLQHWPITITGFRYVTLFDLARVNCR